MFLPPKLTTILLGQLVALTMMTSSVVGQQSDFERRLAAMQQARVRAQAPEASSVRVASSDVGVDYTAPPVPPEARVASRAGDPGLSKKPRRSGHPTASKIPRQPAPKQARTRVAQGSGSTGSYIPQSIQPAPSAHSFIDGGSPIAHSPPISDGGVIIGESYVDEGYVDGGYVDGGYVDGGYVGEEYITEGACPCDSCAGGSYFGQGACNDVVCFPTPRCWLANIGAAFGAAVYNAEFFGGATSFRSPLFETPGGEPGELSNDTSHGFFGGFNLGFPLGFGELSGQVGIRSVQTNFNGNAFTPENRDQLFITTGFYRRVDYGLQAGIVADILHEEWFSENDLVQLRGEASWVFDGRRSFGFRFATNTQDDITSGVFNGNEFTNLVTSSDDNYRFFLRSERLSSGYGELFVGWSDLDQTVVGLDFDVAVTERVGVQAGFTYYLTDEGLPDGTTNLLGGNADESFNVFVGFVLRPRGRSYYDTYNRPLFSVADNGSFLITRENQ